MKTIQITDIHVAGINQIKYSVDCFKNFELILEKVKLENPDRIVITGDLCFEDPEEEIYYLIKDRMDNLKIPYFVIPGNHDDSKMIADIFSHDLIDGECYYSDEKSESIFLDTAVGEMSDQQYQWLEAKLKSSVNFKYIYMHHPPVVAGVRSMDNSEWTFRQIDRFQQLLIEAKRDISIFCGHYHVDRIIKIKNISIYITPSCYIQIADDQEKFAVDHFIPSYRRIENTDNQLSTTLRYLFSKTTYLS